MIPTMGASKSSHLAEVVPHYAYFFAATFRQ